MKDGLLRISSENTQKSIMDYVDRLDTDRFLQPEPALASAVEEKKLAFPIDIFPEKLQRIARILHDDEGLNIDYLCASMLTVLAAAMGNQWVCQFTTTWRVSPIIFMVLVGQPSCGKTPPLRLAVRPFHLFDTELYNLYR